MNSGTGFHSPGAPGIARMLDPCFQPAPSAGWQMLAHSSERAGFALEIAVVDLPGSFVGMGG